MLPVTRPVLRYPGSKARLARWIVSHFPAHEAYCEPFAGSLAVLFAKPRARAETVNDVDGQIVNLFRVMRDQPAELAQQIALTPWARQEYTKSREAHADPVEAARRFLVLCWQSCNSNLRSKTSGWHVDLTGAKAGTTEGQVWRKLPDRLMAAAARLLDVQIENRPAVELIRRCNSERVLLYCDPPYLGETGRSPVYRHEMLSRNDHAEVLHELKQHAGPVVLSGYDHAFYADQLDGWQRQALEACAHGGSARLEVLWLNPVAARASFQRRLFEE